MSRYFFDIRNDVSGIDADGVDFSSAAEAKKEAIRTAGVMLSEKVHLWSGGQWAMDVRDESGAIVAQLKFSVS